MLWPCVSCELSGRVTGAWMHEVESSLDVSGQSCGGLLAGRSLSCPPCYGPGFVCAAQEFSFQRAFLPFITFFFLNKKLWRKKNPTYPSSASRAPNFISVTLLSLTGSFITDSTSELIHLGSVLVYFCSSGSPSSLQRAAYSCLVRTLLGPCSKFLCRISSSY